MNTEKVVSMCTAETYSWSDEDIRRSGKPINCSPIKPESKDLTLRWLKGQSMLALEMQQRTIQCYLYL